MSLLWHYIAFFAIDIDKVVNIFVRATSNSNGNSNIVINVNISTRFDNTLTKTFISTSIVTNATNLLVDRFGSSAKICRFGPATEEEGRGSPVGFQSSVQGHSGGNKPTLKHSWRDAES